MRSVKKCYFFDANLRDNFEILNSNLNDSKLIKNPRQVVGNSNPQKIFEYKGQFMFLLGKLIQDVPTENNCNIQI